jgi:hypothetical protein
MSSVVQICNLALSHLGSGKSIANIETEKSQEAYACNSFYVIARDAVLRDFAWPFATKIVSLGLVEEDPNDEWDFSYGYPSDCLKAIRILSGIRNDDRESRVPFKLVYDDTRQLIYCDQEDAELEYTVRVTDAERFSPDFVLALSFRLAAYISPRITGGDRFKQGERASRMYAFEIERARATGVNEEQPDQLPDSEFIQARE